MLHLTLCVSAGVKYVLKVIRSWDAERWTAFAAASPFGAKASAESAHSCNAASIWEKSAATFAWRLGLRLMRKSDEGCSVAASANIEAAAALCFLDADGALILCDRQAARVKEANSFSFFYRQPPA